jgi:hypothetical protein
VELEDARIVDFGLMKALKGEACTKNLLIQNPKSKI